MWARANGSSWLSAEASAEALAHEHSLIGKGHPESIWVLVALLVWERQKLFGRRRAEEGGHHYTSKYCTSNTGKKRKVVNTHFEL